MKLYEIADKMLILMDIDDESVDVDTELASLQMQFNEKAKNIAKNGEIAKFCVG